ncbi:hypothetical protein CE91St19_29920 [Odoribacter laneus]|jgi:hypothetical protein|uniref:Uncharacterized protein n=1 Tax=Odoribacter laneus YIT 12061 TaxID=742817 RepID=H1DKX0_9BACT|nr:hypothetical protein [Odoribacter laneus]EHP45265.1 hypothetical protein HMPREF9449_02906 [Odoribacter laneus YIT 12061]GKI23590.1 hypothetical protein CE91St19_29920 [Odoribacter laneus]GKI26823.1 hypothetical protein CE91St20_29600 [Odoribacter laneus]
MDKNEYEKGFDRFILKKALGIVLILAAGFMMELSMGIDGILHYISLAVIVILMLIGFRMFYLGF